MSFIFDITGISFDQLAEIITECEVVDIQYKVFFSSPRPASNKITSMELPWRIILKNERDATYAMLKWNLTPSTNIISDT